MVLIGVIGDDPWQTLTIAGSLPARQSFLILPLKPAVSNTRKTPHVRVDECSGDRTATSWPGQ